MAGVEYPPYRRSDRRRVLAAAHGVHIPHVRGVVVARVTALALYAAAAAAVLAIFAPVLPGSPGAVGKAVRDLVTGSGTASALPDAYPTPLPTRRLRVHRHSSVDAVALRAGATTLELYALNGTRIGTLGIRAGTRVRVPAP